MAESGLKDAMDVLQAWVDQYNARAGSKIVLASGGEAGVLSSGSSTRRGRDDLDSASRGSDQGQPACHPREPLRGSTAETSVQAGLWASGQLGRRH